MKLLKKTFALMLSLILVVGMIPGSLMTAHAYIGEIVPITDEELLEVMEVDLRIGNGIIASSESTSFSKMSGTGWELKLSKQDNENRMQYYIVLHLYDYDVPDGYIDFMYDMKPAADPMNSVSFQVSVHGDCHVGFIRALTTDKEKVYGSSLDIIFAAGATLDTKQISHQGTGQWGSDIELNLRGVPGGQPGILYTKEITNHYYFIDWPHDSEPVTYADNLIIINYNTPPSGGPLFNLGEDERTYKVQFSETVDLFLNTDDGQFPIFGEYANEELAQKYQYIEDDGITAFSDLRAHLRLKESGDPADEYTVGDSIYYYFFPELTMLDYLFKAGINEQFKGARGFKVESSYKLTNLTEGQEVTSGSVTGIEKEYSYEEDNFVKVAGINGEEYFTFETPGLYELCATVKLIHNGNVVDSVGKVYHFQVNDKPCTHNYEEISNTATCTDNGVKTEKCTLCGVTQESTSYALGHAAITGEYAYSETEHWQVCKNCNQVINVGGHTSATACTVCAFNNACEPDENYEWKSDDTHHWIECWTDHECPNNNQLFKSAHIAKTRESTDWTASANPVHDSVAVGEFVYSCQTGFYCKECLEYFGEKGIHKWVLDESQSDATKDVYVCAYDGDYLDDGQTKITCNATKTINKAAHEHVWDIEHPEVVTPANCTTDGTSKITCKDTSCNESVEITVPATGHNWGEWNNGAPIIAPPCTAANDLVIERTCSNANCPVGTESKTISRVHAAMGWTTDATDHWKVCTYGCGTIVVEKEAHTDADSNKKCDVCEYDMAPAQSATEYDITVTGGTASANKAVAGTSITLTAEQIDGKVFSHWEVNGATVSDANAKETTFTMGNADVTAEAIYDDCECKCHKGGIVGFFYKIVLFFQKLFGNNLVCNCGKKH